jgi:hypothetical protein
MTERPNPYLELTVNNVHLSEGDQVGVGHLLPLLNEPHTLGVHQPIVQ